MDRGAWQATLHGITKESDTTYWLDNNSTNTGLQNAWDKSIAGKLEVCSRMLLIRRRGQAHSASGSSRWAAEVSTSSSTILPVTSEVHYLADPMAIWNIKRPSIPGEKGEGTHSLAMWWIRFFHTSSCQTDEQLLTESGYTMWAGPRTNQI